jgi:16S rRNA (uracil1498-N3)-methyltransferase
LAVAAHPRGDGGPHVFVESLEDLDLDPGDHHHLAASLRLALGDPLTASDGRGRWRPCRFGDPLEPAGEIFVVARPEPAIIVGFALIKGSRPELVVQKLTELGVDRIIPFTAARSVVRTDPQRVAKQTARLARVAREAAMQSRRVWLPAIDAPTTFERVAALESAVRCDPGGRAPVVTDTCLLIGPEGGWSSEERQALPDAVTLGQQVLRAETAAIAAAALAGALREGIVRHSLC